MIYAFVNRSAVKFDIISAVGYYKNVRTLLLKQFPYHIHYLVDDAGLKIVILAIIHAYKDPSDYSIR